MKGCPTMLVLSNNEAIEGGMEVEEANSYLNGAYCGLIGTIMRLPNGKEVKVHDLLIKVVIGSAFRVYTN